MAAKVVTAEQMRASEERAAALGVPPSELMDHAGRAVARVVEEAARRRRRQGVLVLVGPGNNGGDGLVAARYLAAAGLPVTTYVWHRTTQGDRVREQAIEAGVPLILAEADADRARLRAEVERADVLIDSLLGTGLRRALSEELRGILSAVREAVQGRLVVAVDVPSGLNSDTGEVDEVTLPADLTVTLGHPKVGLLVWPGARWAGKVVWVDIGLPPGAEVAGMADVMDDEQVARLLPERPPYSHKGTFGKAMVVAGSPNYVGAATLACEAAYRVGAGLVTLASARGLHPIMAQKLTETTFLPLAEDSSGTLGPSSLPEVLEGLAGYDSLLVGPGLGRLSPTVAFVRALVAEYVARGQAGETSPLLVLDADALNALAGSGEWWQGLGPATVVTPHAAEMARLLGRSIPEVEKHRLAVVRQAAADWGLVVILKGAYTVVGTPDGRLSVSPVATSSLATAGSGDVLAGALVGLAAQGASAGAAATAAVYLHGRAGEMVAARQGEAGCTAGDLLPLLPEVARRLRALATGWRCNAEPIVT